MQAAIHHLRTADPVLAGIIERVGEYRMEFREPSFETLARAIVFQQLAGRAASTIFGRLLKAAGGAPLTPEKVLRLRPARMRAAGLSPQKTAYVRDLARRARDGEIDFVHLPRLSDEEVIRQLTRVKGIGVWTAHMFLIFALHRSDVLPTGDLGVRAAMRKAYGMKELPKAAEMEEIARSWRPYCSVASWYLWRSLDAPVEI
ncbi:MAG: DNA-3-methyladenine glycosylase [Bryobacteraceae bacterium]